MLEDISCWLGDKAARGCIRLGWVVVRLARKDAARLQKRGCTKPSENIREIAERLALMLCEAEISLDFKRTEYYEVTRLIRRGLLDTRALIEYELMSC